MKSKENFPKISKQEYDYLLWFRHNADFGPAHQDVIIEMNQNYEEETGNEIPSGWKDE